MIFGHCAFDPGWRPGAFSRLLACGFPEARNAASKSSFRIPQVFWLGFPSHDFVDKTNREGKIHAKMRNRGHAGFTLIELLVVIVIIGILSSMSVGASFGGTKRRRKDRQSQIDALQLALEQYKSDMGGYPRTDDLSSDNERVRGILFFQAFLTGLVDRFGDKVKADRRDGLFAELGFDEQGSDRRW